MERDDILDHIMAASLDRAQAMLALGPTFLRGEIATVETLRGTVATLNQVIEQFARMLVETRKQDQTP